MSFHVPSEHRIVTGPLRSSHAEGNNGAFRIPNGFGKAPLMVIASDGEGWEHVSVSLATRCPSWDEMCKVKLIFWDEEDCVVQFHPPRSLYVNNYPYCLHLWRPINFAIQMPDSLLVGLRELNR